MRHGKVAHGRSKLGRGYKHRKALMRTMVTQLIQHERIKTTVAKANKLKRYADRMVSYGKRVKNKI